MRRTDGIGGRFVEGIDHCGWKISPGSMIDDIAKILEIFSRLDALHLKNIANVRSIEDVLQSPILHCPSWKSFLPLHTSFPVEWCCHWRHSLDTRCFRRSPFPRRTNRSTRVFPLKEKVRFFQMTSMIRLRNALIVPSDLTFFSGLRRERTSTLSTAFALETSSIQLAF